MEVVRKLKFPNYSIDGKKYLSKFVQMDYEYNNRQQIDSWLRNELEKYKINESVQQHIVSNQSRISDINNEFNLSFRDMQKLFIILKRIIILQTRETS
jgi:hypothetical protein